MELWWDWWDAFSPTESGSPLRRKSEKLGTEQVVRVEVVPGVHRQFSGGMARALPCCPGGQGPAAVENDARFSFVRSSDTNKFSNNCNGESHFRSER